MRPDNRPAPRAHRRPARAHHRPRPARPDVRQSVLWCGRSGPAAWLARQRCIGRDKTASARSRAGCWTTRTAISAPRRVRGRPGRAGACSAGRHRYPPATAELPRSRTAGHRGFPAPGSTRWGSAPDSRAISGRGRRGPPARRRTAHPIPATPDGYTARHCQGQNAGAGSSCDFSRTTAVQVHTKTTCRSAGQAKNFS